MSQAKSVRTCLAMAMRDPERWCVAMKYEDSKGNVTHRYVSPIAYLDGLGNQFRALCLGREQPRQFVTERCSEVELVHSADILMPMPITEIQSGGEVDQGLFGQCVPAQGHSG